MKKFWIIFLFILKVSFIGFGGGNALLPVIQNEAVQKRKWLSQEEFDDIVIVTNMLPGPSVIQSISYIAIKELGKFWGSLCTLIAILPHVLFAFALYIAATFLPLEYLWTIAVGVLSTIIGILIVFGWTYMQKTRKLIKLPLWIFLFLFTFAFCFFVPVPGNLPILVMLAVFLIIALIALFAYLKHKKEKRKKC
ncbi:chromate transporter [Mycoplasmopsis gallinarum]|uniref:Chromate transport protein n=1 Tax=Mycoplasmopsis gallinarum TaxID=29557 RepID=A0A168R814_9BACT|nr:chromate transporter [Mycoplasmopsis gallinarum]OAB48697.1 Chromate transport protein [Mycoplasmopsis gallinarum]